MEERSICQKENFRSVFTDCSESVRNYIYYNCGDLYLAEDIVQESFIKLWENCVKVSVDKAKSFVYKVARNKMLNHIAHKKVVLKYAKLSNSESNIQDPEFLIEEKEFEGKLMKCIQELPPKQRECFLLSRIDKKTYKEISEIVGVTVKAVEKRMQLALESLRKKLGNFL